MTAPATAPGYDWLGYPLNTPTGIRCGMCGNGVRHIDVQAVKDCHYITREQEANQEADARAEAAAERHLEDRGYWAAQEQDAYEARNGVIGFREAWHNESPHTCPCCN